VDESGAQVIVISTRRGRDGRDYPVQMPPPKPWRWLVVTITHELAHVQGLSLRKTQAGLLARGYRRSRGIIAADLERRMPGCPVCQASDGS
jgi:hypothetical protein